MNINRQAFLGLPCFALVSVECDFFSKAEPRLRDLLGYRFGFPTHEAFFMS
jgi:hypothetical protein